MKNIKNFTRSSLKFLGLSFVLMSSNLFANTPENVILETTVEWQSPPGALIVPANPNTPLVSFKGKTFYLWIDAGNRPWITQLDNGVPTVVPLDPNPDYVMQPDGHHRFSIGVDKNGYIHVAGDMHNYTYYTDGVINPYPKRYQRQGILYWKSNNPVDVGGGFSFAGAKDSATTIPSTGWLLGHFFTDNHGELYYSSQIHAVEGAHLPGMMGQGLFRYNADNAKWTALGDYPKVNRPGITHQCVFWEESGVSPTGWFQGFEACFKFDPQDRMHMSIVANTDVNRAGTDKVLYAVSSDGGATWAKANGQMIPGLPLRGADGQPNLADVVYDGGAAGPYTGFSAGLAVDKNGTPAVLVDSKSYMWDGTQWTKTNALTFPGFIAPNYGYLNPDHEALLLVAGASKYVRAEEFGAVTQGYDPAVAFPNSSYYCCIDEYGFKTTGVIRGITVDKTTNIQSIVKTRVIKAPLPEGWKSEDISANSFAYGGSSGYSKGAFSMIDYGGAIGDQSDSFHFVYKEMTGDGSITAKVFAGVPSPEEYGQCGVMMRAHLSHNSQFAAMMIAPGKKASGARYVTRSKAADWAWATNLLPGAIATTYWTKLTRSGNTFTGFVSPDGVTWTQVSSTTAAMPNTIYVGLAGNRNARNWYMQVSTYTNVSVSQ